MTFPGKIAHVIKLVL